MSPLAANQKKLSKKLSVIVPAYRESKNIYRNLITLQKELDQLDREYEIVVVCDGCADTYGEARKLASDNLKVYHYEKNMGKGYALKYGADRVTGELVTFIDADMNIHPKEIDIFTKLMDIYDADIVIGSKRHPQSKIHYPLFRRFQSFIYQMLIAILFRINVKDTQTGLKLFKRDVLRKVLPRIVVKAYAFDLELLVVAHRLGYNKIIEAPIEIKQQFSTTTNLGAAWKVLWDTAAIFYRSRILKYYDQPHVFTEPAKAEPRVSVVIPVAKINNYVRESIGHIAELGYSNFETLVLPDENSKTDNLSKVKVVSTGPVGPAEKRDLSLKYANGEILAFLDDDAYPRQDWLVNAARHFQNPQVAAVAGPAVTAENDGLLQQASGAVYESRLGGGTLTYRYLPKTLREVDDHPSVNFLVRKDIFEKVGGFDSSYWPGEDTKLCLDITRLGKKIIYDPDVLVWHHRRRLFLPHLRQVANYALHRGYFVKAYPETSFRMTYFLPTLGVIGLVGGLALSFFSRTILVIYLTAMAIYFLALLFTAFWTALMRTNILIGLLVIPGILATHLTYGIYFVKGLLTRELKK